MLNIVQAFEPLNIVQALELSVWRAPNITANIQSTMGFPGENYCFRDWTLWHCILLHFLPFPAPTSTPSEQPYVRLTRRASLV